MKNKNFILLIFPVCLYGCGSKINQVKSVLNKANHEVVSPTIAALVQSSVKRFQKDTTIEKNDIKVSLTIDTSQILSNHGIRFSLNFKNKSNQDKTILNPVDFFTLSLLNNKGFNVSFPYISRIRTDQPRINLREAFIIDSIRLENDISKIDIFEQKTITIPPNKNFKIFLRIENVLKSDAIKPYDTNQLIKIQPDHYRFLIILSLVENGKAESVDFGIQQITYSL